MVKFSSVALSGVQGGLGGLTSYTTYYAEPFSSWTFGLTKCSTCALALSAKDALVITSTSSQLIANLFTIAPVAPSGNPALWTAPTYAWQGSNDSVAWGNLMLSASSGTYTASVSSTVTPSPVLTDFGQYNYRYLRLNVTVPAQQTGSLLLQVPINIKQDGIGRY
jgi:hypothetical protein